MSAALTFHIEDTATPVLRRVSLGVKGKELRQAMGESVRRTVSDHLVAKNQEPNKQNFPKTNFYGNAAQSITMQVDDSGATVSVTQTGMRQRYFGGDILPIHGTFLTIPACAVAYGRRAGEFGGLKFTYAQDEQGFIRPALVSTDALTLRGSQPRNKKGQGSKPPLDAGTVLYWLVRAVHQEPDPTVLPTNEEIEDAAQLGVSEYLKAISAIRGTDSMEMDDV